MHASFSSRWGPTAPGITAFLTSCTEGEMSLSARPAPALALRLLSRPVPFVLFLTMRLNPFFGQGNVKNFFFFLRRFHFLLRVSEREPVFTQKAALPFTHLRENRALGAL